MPNFVLTSHMPNQSVRVLETVILIIILQKLTVLSGAVFC